MRISSALRRKVIIFISLEECSFAHLAGKTLQSNLIYFTEPFLQETYRTELLGQRIEH
jgi:hypothetical protein